ncbi:MAG: dethiobiotin synthase [Limisphaerales bacterium]
MTSRIWFITGSDTQVGKTFLTVLLSNHLAQRRKRFAAVKPFCSGDRTDAELIHRAQRGGLELEAINPWHFRQPVTPSLAARQEGREVTLRLALTFLRRASQGTPRLFIEGAGGLLSPLGRGFSARELIMRLDATPLVVCPNRLGAINQSRLVFAALPRRLARRGHLVLMDPERPDESTSSNALVLAEHLASDRIHRLPWSPGGPSQTPSPRVRRTLECLLS